MEFQKISVAEIEGLFKAQLAERSKAQRRLAELKVERDAYLANKEKEQAGQPLTLDQALRQTIREQAGKLNFTFSAE